MLDSIFATKLDMTQAWSKDGKRLAVTRCMVKDNLVIDKKSEDIYEIGYGDKKLKNMSKPLQSKMQQSGFSIGATKLAGLSFRHSQKDQDDQAEEKNTPLKRGDVVKVGQVLAIGDVVKVQGTTKGRGFTGVVKHYGFKGGKRTHGQSDRMRAPGSIGSGTNPGRVWKGKKMPGHYGGDTRTISGLVVIHLDPQTGEVWLNGPIPGHYSGIVRIIKTGDKKTLELDKAASGIAEEAKLTPESEIKKESVKKEPKKEEKQTTTQGEKSKGSKETETKKDSKVEKPVEK